MAKINSFWVVTKATSRSGIRDILFKSTIQKMRLQFAGGLTSSEIIGTYQFKTEALKVAKRQLKRFR